MAYYGFDGLINPIFAAYDDDAWEAEKPPKREQPKPEWDLLSFKVTENPVFIAIGDEILVDEPTPKIDGEGSWYLGKSVCRVKVADIYIELDESYWDGKVNWNSKRDAKKINFSTLKNCSPFMYVWVKTEGGDYYGGNELLGKAEDETVPTKSNEVRQISASDDLDF